MDQRRRPCRSALIYGLWLAALSLSPASWARALAELSSPFGVPWGATVVQTQSVLSRMFSPVGTFKAPSGEFFLHEQRYSGQVQGLEADHISPLFFIGRLFGFAVSWSPRSDLPATQIWYNAVDRLSAQYGAPEILTKPERLVSPVAVLKLHPEMAAQGGMLAMYQAADHPRTTGEYLLLDLTVRSRGWVPEAAWRFKDGAWIRVVMRAEGPDDQGLLHGLKPALLYLYRDPSAPAASKP